MKTDKLDFVYILGYGCKWGDNNDIRYSLRSLDKYVPHRRIFIVGECPVWARNVTHIPAEDPTTKKPLNAAHKIQVACKDPRISNNFILMNDDFFFLSPVNTIPYIHRGTMKQQADEHPTKRGYYYQTLLNGLEFLNQRGFKDPRNFSLHYPFPYNKKLFLELFKQLNWPSTMYPLRSLYGNLYAKKTEKWQADVKIKNIADLPELAKGNFISTDNDVARHPRMRKFLRHQFPEQSRYDSQ